MTLHHGDCLDVMAAMEPESVDAIVTDPPYGLEFMGKEWDKFAPEPTIKRSGWDVAASQHKITEHTEGSPFGRVAYHKRRSTWECRGCGKRDGFRNAHPCGDQWSAVWIDPKPLEALSFQAWCQQWAEAAYRVAKPSAYLLAFGGTRTVHRMTVALEDAGWIIRDMLVWGYASGFPKSKASLKPAWEPIVMARKPGPLRMLAIDECRIPIDPGDKWFKGVTFVNSSGWQPGSPADRGDIEAKADPAGRWPANIVLTDPIFDGGVEGVVGGGEAVSRGGAAFTKAGYEGGWTPPNDGTVQIGYGDTGTYSRFFLIPKADRADREPVLGGLPLRNAAVPAGPVPGMPRQDGSMRGPVTRANVHPTVKPVDLMRHLVRLVTPTGGVVLDPFLGSGTTAIAAEMEGFEWIGIEREAEYVAIAEARLNGTQRGLGLEAS